MSLEYLLLHQLIAELLRFSQLIDISVNLNYNYVTILTMQYHWHRNQDLYSS
jgi:hypothetical protein